MDIIEFLDECLPYNIMAKDNRFIICSRHLDVNEDYNLLKHRVDMGSYFTVYEAYEDNKDSAIYTIVDRLNNIRSCDNMIFEIIDYFDIKDCKKALDMLNNNELGLSMRSKVELKIKEIKWNTEKL